MGLQRRRLLEVAAGLVGSVWLQPASATADELAAAVAAYAGGAPVREGRVEFDIAPLVENGNAVPITVRAQSPMSEADHVAAIAIFNESNPQRDVAVFHLGPPPGPAQIATPIRPAPPPQRRR